MYSNIFVVKQKLLCIVAFLGVLFGACVHIVEGNKNHSSCEEHLHKDYGTIAYPTNTLSKHRCTWVIESTKDRIELKFTEFVMRTTCCSCTHDFVEIFDGERNSSHLIGRYCANSYPEKLYSTGKYLRITFYSDYMVNEDNRMRVVFRSICGKHMSGYAGQITALSRESSAECIYSVAVPSHRLRLKFSSMNLFQFRDELNMDCLHYLRVGEDLKVMSSDIDKSRRYTKYCLSNPIPDIYSTKGSVLWFKFDRTQYAVQFHAIYTVILSGEETCKDTITEKYGTVLSVGYPFAYPPKTLCTWVIQGPPDKYIHLVFNTFEFGSKDDFCATGNEVQVYSGRQNRSTGNLISSYCSADLPPPVVVSDTNVMVIVSSSLGASKSQPNFVGFAAQFYALDKGICNSDEFKCNNRMCIPYHNWCDGVMNCVDGTDENGCVDVQTRGYTFQWYKIWPITIILALLIIIMWLWRVSRRSLFSHINNPHLPGDRSGSVDHMSDITLPDENFAPPPYSETDGDVILSGKLPTYEEATSVIPGTSQRNGNSEVTNENNLMLVNNDGTVVSYQRQRQQHNTNSPGGREEMNVDLQNQSDVSV